MSIQEFRGLKPVSVLVLITFLLQSFLPLTGCSSKKETPSESKSKAGQQLPDFDSYLLELIRRLDGIEGKAKKGEGSEAEISSVNDIYGKIKEADEKIREEFSKTEEFLKEKKLSQEIISRHTEFVEKYEEKYASLSNLLDRFPGEGSTFRDDLRVLKKFLQENTRKPIASKIDPNKLPHRIYEGKPKKPRMTIEEYQKAPEFKQKTENRGQKTDKKIQKQGWNHLIPEEGVQVASLSLEPLLSLSSVNAIPAPTQDDLAETVEVQFTEEIRALATELGNQPVAIYNWVRNNIDFVPTYGSIQGSNHCLMTKQCNAFDTASLLIAMLRVSGIHARYVYGTIEIPIEKVMNWVGGVEKPEVAGQVLASGGIPSMLVIEGGKVTKVRMEHVWVESYVDYIPSEGAVHKVGDTWIPLDTSYKMHDFKSPRDLYKDMGIRGLPTLYAFLNSRDPLEELGLAGEDITNITPQQYISSTIMNWMNNINPDWTVSDLVGAFTIQEAKSITKEEVPYLAGTLPYKVIAVANRFTEVFSKDRHIVEIKFSKDAQTEISLSYPVAFASRKRITLSFEPATEEDRQLIEKYGLLFNVPAYLLNLKPVLRFEGNPVAEGLSHSAGDDVALELILRTPWGSNEKAIHELIVGEYGGITIYPQFQYENESPTRMALLRENAFKVGTPLTPDLDELLGEMLLNTGIIYFNSISSEQRFYAHQLKVIFNKLPSEAWVADGVNVNKLFGTPIKLEEAGLKIDVQADLYIPISMDGNRERASSFMTLAGMGSSAGEHYVLETFARVPGISAIKALRKAAIDGIGYTTITQENITQILPTLAIPVEVKKAIQDAINAGKIAIVSNGEITLEQWHGVGYIFLNTTTGDGAYLISGGIWGGNVTRPPEDPMVVRDFYNQKWMSSTMRAEIYSCAKNKIGINYELGCPYLKSCPDESRFDCSGLAAKCYNEAGIPDLKCWTATKPEIRATCDKDGLKYKCGTTHCGGADCFYQNMSHWVGDASEARMGDLYFFSGTRNATQYCPNPTDAITHVGIATGSGDEMIYAGETKGVVKWNVDKYVNYLKEHGYPNVKFEAIGDALWLYR